MPLRDLDEFLSWISRESPTQAAQKIALDFLVAAGRTSYIAPSVPILGLSNQPLDEVRQAQLAVESETDVRVWYRHTYATDDVDVIAITQHDLDDKFDPE